MADIRGLIYAVILGGFVLTIALETFISSMQSVYSGNIAPGNQSQNFTYTNQVGNMNSTINKIQNSMQGQSGISNNPLDILSATGNAIWGTAQLLFSVVGMYVTITADIISAFSVGGIPVGWVAAGVIMMVTTNVAIDLLSGWQKYRW